MNVENKKSVSARHPSPRGIMIVIIISVFLSEMLVMATLSLFPEFHTTIIADIILDTSLTVALVLIILYLFRAKCERYYKPTELRILVVMTIAAVEVVVMILLSYFPQAPDIVKDMLDSIILVIVLIPVLCLQRLKNGKAISSFQTIIIVVSALLFADMLVVVFMASMPKAYANMEIVISPILHLLLLSPILYIFLYQYIKNLNMAENTARLNGESLSQAQRIAHLGNWEVDIKTGKTRWSEELYRMYGYGPGQVEPTYRRFMKIVHPDDRKKVEELGRKFFSGKISSARTELRIKRGDGEERIIEDRIELRLDEKGRPLKLVGTNLDITERKKAEEGLKDSEEWMRTMASSVNDAIIMINDAGKITYWNPAASRIFEYDQEEVIGEYVHEKIIPEDFLERHKNSFKKFIDTGVGNLIDRTAEFEGIRKGGERFPLELSLSSILLRDKIHAVGVIRDITDRKKYEQSLKDANARLQEAFDNLNETQQQLIRSEKLASLGALSAGVAHEIKNPLNIISTIVQLLQVEEELPEETKKEYCTIMEQIDRAVKITENLRFFAKERSPEVTNVGLNELLDKTISLVEYEMNVENIHFVRDFNPEEIRVLGDPDQLAQVFLNVVGNARESMNEKQASAGYKKLKEAGWEGVVFIKTRVEENSAIMWIEDTGMGIPKEIINKIFDPFFSTKEKGTGLGLSVIAGIIETHNGKIESSSEKGRGALFTITLPLADEEDKTDGTCNGR